MQALAMGCELAFFARLASPGGQIATTRLPVQSLLAPLLGTTFFIVVLRIGSPSLAIHLPKQSTQFLLVGGQFLTEAFQSGFSLPWDDGDGRGTQICADDVGANGVLGFVIGYPLQCQLHRVAVALSIASCGTLA